MRDELDGFEDALDEFEDAFDEEAEEDLADDTDAFVIGSDARVRVHPRPRNPSTRLFPFNSICYIERRGGRGFEAHGTGTLVAPRVVLTAGHVVAYPGARAGLRITPGAAFDAAQPAMRSAGRPAAQVVGPGAFRRPAGYAATTRTDFAVVILPRPFTRPARFMPLQARAASRSTILVTIAGFPGDKNGVRPGSMWRDSERIETVATADGMLRHRVDTMPGNSGGPIWLLGAGDTRIQIGVHVGFDRGVGRNIGVRITNRVLAQIAAWCRAAGVRPPRMWPQRTS